VAEVNIALRDLDEERILFGHLDKNLRLVRLAFDVEAVSRGGRLTLSGDPQRIEAAAQRIEQALKLIRDNQASVAEISELFRQDAAAAQGRTSPAQGPPLLARPRSRNQEIYMDAIRSHAVTFGIGPAGSGKTFLAIAMAVSMLRAGEFRKIVLTRPAVEAGEHLGFLPGELEDKINPYLRPLFDALDELMPRGTLPRYLEQGIIELSPLAYMRGRTLNNSVIILDEAQNTTAAQMKMCLTRLGQSSKIIVTGDVTQIDLPSVKQSGLMQAVQILQRVPELAFCFLKDEDIVRHPVVRAIVNAYGSWDERQRQEEASERRRIELAPAAPPRAPGRRDGENPGR
jgi:phosphate starvation-inducible protein PhoH and related proteins